MSTQSWFRICTETQLKQKNTSDALVCAAKVSRLDWDRGNKNHLFTECKGDSGKPDGEGINTQCRHNSTFKS